MEVPHEILNLLQELFSFASAFEAQMIFNFIFVLVYMWSFSSLDEHSNNLVRFFSCEMKY